MHVQQLTVPAAIFHRDAIVTSAKKAWLCFGLFVGFVCLWG